MTNTFKPISRRTVIGGFAALPAEGWLHPSWGTSSTASTPETTAGTGQPLNVMAFEALARAALPPAHFGYIATGGDDDRTVSINHEAFSQWEIRSRRFIDASHLDATVRVFGAEWATPIYLSAVSSMRAFHADGEAAVARAAASRSMQLMLSTGASVPVEEVVRARGGPVWQQL
jgi:4-hydroxymandelate oxidase